MYDEKSIKDFMNFAGYQGLFSNDEEMKPVLSNCYAIFKKNSENVVVGSEKQYYV